MLFSSGPRSSIGAGKVDDGCAVSVGTYGLCPYTGSFSQAAATAVGYGESIEFAVELSGSGSAPGSAVAACHCQRVDGGSVAVRIVYIDCGGFGFRRPHCEMRAVAVDSKFKVVAVVDRPCGVV